MIECYIFVNEVILGQNMFARLDQIGHSVKVELEEELRHLELLPPSALAVAGTPEESAEAGSVKSLEPVSPAVVLRGL